MDTASEIQTQIERAEAQIRELREKLLSQKTEERRAAIAEVKKLIKTHALSAADVGLSSSRLKTAKAGGSPKLGVKVAPKYRDPATGNTWTGRGKTPNWLVAKLAAGQSKDDFAV